MLSAALSKGQGVQGIARAKKRCLGGLREVSWAVKKPGRTALVLLACNIQVEPDSVLMKEVVQLVNKCEEVGVLVVVSLTRKQLGSCFASGVYHLHASIDESN